MYRGTAGRMCAAGCLIPDSEYTPAMEGAAVATLPFFRGWSRDTVRLLTRLQRAHDTHAPAYWESFFPIIARDFGLVYTAPETDAEVQS